MRALRSWAILAATGWLVAGSAGAVVACVVLLVVPGVLAKRRRARRERSLTTDLAVALELAARAVRSGRSAYQALCHVVASQPEDAGGVLAELVAEAELEPLGLAADRWARRHKSDAVTIVAATVGLVADGEADAARAFEAAAAHLAATADAAGEASAWAAQARASATLLVVAPGVLALVALVLDPATLTRLLSDSLTVDVVLFGGVLEVIGVVWMRRLVGRSRTWTR